MRCLLAVKGLSKALESDTDNASAKALGLIILHVSENLQFMLASTKSAKEAWGTLKELFDQQTTARKMGLRRALAQLAQQPSESVTVYVNRAIAMQKALRGIGKEVDDGDLVVSLLNGVSPAFQTQADFLSMQDPAPTVRKLLSVLLQAEANQLRKAEQRALYVQAQRRSESARNDQNRQRGQFSVGETRKCYYFK